MTLKETYAGGGTVGTEVKYVHYNVHNTNKLYSGFQEEWTVLGKVFLLGQGYLQHPQLAEMLR